MEPASTLVSAQWQGTRSKARAPKTVASSSAWREKTTGCPTTLLSRFANPSIADPLARLCQRGSTKVSAYLLPLLTLAVAGWFRYPRAVDLDGAPITVVDARADRLQSLAQAGGDDPRPLLTVRELFGGLGDQSSRACIPASPKRAASHAARLPP